MTRLLCKKCGLDIPYQGSKHDKSELCRLRVEMQKIHARGLIAVSPPAPTSAGHTNRAGTIAVCKIFGLEYKLVATKGKVHYKPWICVTPEVEGTLRAVNEIAGYLVCVIPEAARRLVDKRDVLIEFDALRRLGADHDTLFDFVALAGLIGEEAQFETRLRQRNPNRSDLSIRRAWDKFKFHRRARNLKTKP